MMTPKDVLRAAADLIESTSFSPGACARDESGAVVDAKIGAHSYCVSGAARAVLGGVSDGDGTEEENLYLLAMDLFTSHVQVVSVMSWADSGRTTVEVVTTMRAAAS